MDTNATLAQLGISAGLGLLVGIQRERAGSRFGGIRTFPLIAVLGTVSGLISKELDSAWVIAGGLLALAGLAAASNSVARKEEDRDAGMTTEVAALLMYALGAYAAFGPAAVVMAIGVGAAVLLYAKEGLHGFTDRIGDTDMRAIMLFAAITFVILPVLPNRTMGPLNVLNPHNIWLMVVLVVGISLGGYIAYKVLGSRAGAVLGGILGGLISSTATTVTYARRAAESPANVGPALLVIVLAGTVVYARLFAEISIVAPNFLDRAGPPLAIMFAASCSLAAVIWVVTRKQTGQPSAQENPTQLRSALMFAGLYALVTLAVAAGERYYANSGLYAVAAVSGLTDMDAITLSTSRLVDKGSVPPDSGWKAILIASISNLVFKIGIIASLGGRRLVRWAALIAAVKITVAVLVILLW